jgi:dTDP-4-dehydrorhamnose 3,5-epimerase
VKVESTLLQDMVVIEPQVFGDDRGFFKETWSSNGFSKAGLDLTFVQDNFSRSAQGILRGLHYQTENTQGKLVSVSSGEVFDVAIDLRRSSPSFGKWFGLLLSAENHKMLWVPPGFAHGFYVTSEYADFQYKCTDFYNPGASISLAWDDPTIGIDWPLLPDQLPQVSGNDLQGLALADAPMFD